MLIDDRIKFYEEVLEEDPSSKLFFPLARLYLEQEEMQKSINVLRSGLEKHPEHLEARLMLIELLAKEGDGISSEEVDEHIRRVERIFKGYPSFWERWADILAQDGDSEIAGLVGLLGLKFALGDIDSLGSLIYKGIKGIREGSSYFREGTGETGESFGGGNSPSEKDRGIIEKESISSVDFKTKTMADILFSQGNYEDALEIYEELYRTIEDKTRRKELRACILKTRQKLEGKDMSNTMKRDKKRRLLSRLTRLAQRLESRARAVM